MLHRAGVDAGLPLVPPRLGNRLWIVAGRPSQSSDPRSCLAFSGVSLSAHCGGSSLFGSACASIICSAMASTVTVPGFQAPLRVCYRLRIVVQGLLNQNAAILSNCAGVSLSGSISISSSARSDACRALACTARRFASGSSRTFDSRIAVFSRFRPPVISAAKVPVEAESQRSQTPQNLRAR
jgi:hypothetical protein